MPRVLTPYSFRGRTSGNICRPKARRSLAARAPRATKINGDNPPPPQRVAKRPGSGGAALRLDPGVDFPLGFGLGEAVARLQAADQFAPAAADARHVLVGKLGPV